jgi:hypothetical protein
VSKSATASAATGWPCRFRSPATPTPKARPETPEPPPAPATGISYLELVSAAHHQQIAADTRIGFHALYPSPPLDTADTTDLDLDALAADPITDPATEATDGSTSEVDAAQKHEVRR